MKKRIQMIASALLMIASTSQAAPSEMIQIPAGATFTVKQDIDFWPNSNRFDLINQYYPTGSERCVLQLKEQASSGVRRVARGTKLVVKNVSVNADEGTLYIYLESRNLLGILCNYNARISEFEFRLRDYLTLDITSQVVVID